MVGNVLSAHLLSFVSREYIINHRWIKNIGRLQPEFFQKIVRELSTNLKNCCCAKITCNRALVVLIPGGVLKIQYIFPLPQVSIFDRYASAQRMINNFSISSLAESEEESLLGNLRLNGQYIPTSSLRINSRNIVKWSLFLLGNSVCEYANLKALIYHILIYEVLLHLTMYGGMYVICQAVIFSTFALTVPS